MSEQKTPLRGGFMAFPSPTKKQSFEHIFDQPLDTMTTETLYLEESVQSVRMAKVFEALGFTVMFIVKYDDGVIDIVPFRKTRLGKTTP